MKRIISFFVTAMVAGTALFALAGCDKSIKIGFDTGTQEKLAPIKRNVGDEYGQLPIIEKAGFEFEGWWFADGTEVTAETPVTNQKNHTLHAEWKSVDTHTLALTNSRCYCIDKEGTLWAWGEANNIFGDGAVDDCRTPMKLMEDRKFVFITASYGAASRDYSGHVFAIDVEGGLWAWGNNAFGQLGDGTTTDREIPVQIMEGTKFTYVFASGYSSSAMGAAIDENGNIFTWGGPYATLGYENGSLIPVQITSGVRFRSVYSYGSRSYAITEDGVLYVWGDTMKPATSPLGRPTLILENISPHIMMSAQNIRFKTVVTNYGLDENGVIFNWSSTFEKPQQCEIEGKAEKLWQGDGYVSYLTKDGNIYALGSNRLVFGENSNSTEPVKVFQNMHFVSIEASGSNMIAMDDMYNVYVWGNNEYGQLANGSLTQIVSPIQIKNKAQFTGVFVGAGDENNKEKFYLTDKNGGLWILNQKPEKVLDHANIASFSSSEYNHSLALDKDGRLWAWGKNDYGQLGDGTTERRSTPVQIMEEKRFRFILAFQWNSFAIDDDGGLWAWGDNSTGQIGDGSTVNRLVPVAIAQGKRFSHVSGVARLFFQSTLAIDEDGGLWSWGANDYGQLGDGTTKDRYTPAQILQGTQFTTVFHKGGSCFALDAGGGLWAWGENFGGYLCDGTTENRSVPVQIMKGLSFRQILLDTIDIYAIDSDGNFLTWERGTTVRVNKITNGSFVSMLEKGGVFLLTDEEGGLWEYLHFSASEPKRIMEGTQICSAYNNIAQQFAIDKEGKLWAWGWNKKRELGDGTRKDRDGPVHIITEKKFMSFDFISSDYAAVDTEGSVWIWGENKSGLFGLGYKSSSIEYTPQLVKFC